MQVLHVLQSETVVLYKILYIKITSILNKQILLQYKQEALHRYKN